MILHLAITVSVPCCGPAVRLGALVIGYGIIGSCRLVKSCAKNQGLIARWKYLDVGDRPGHGPFALYSWRGKDTPAWLVVPPLLKRM